VAPAVAGLGGLGSVVAGMSGALGGWSGEMCGLVCNREGGGGAGGQRKKGTSSVNGVSLDLWWIMLYRKIRRLVKGA
jgi:hypothetical protein